VSPAEPSRWDAFTRHELEALADSLGSADQDAHVLRQGIEPFVTLAREVEAALLKITPSADPPSETPPV
jgi:hypothetical protein